MSGPPPTSECRVNQEQMLELLVGKRIGSGYSRHVYPIYHLPDRVLKVEHTGYSFHNIMEWNIWQEVKDTPMAVWFAPCLDIDSLGCAMTQRKTKVFKSEEEFAKACPEIPAFFDDVHYGNWGMLRGRPVCHDYAYNYLLARGLRSKRMKKNPSGKDK